jgi:hypothetical protein
MGPWMPMRIPASACSELDGWRYAGSNPHTGRYRRRRPREELRQAGRAATCGALSAARVLSPRSSFWWSCATGSRSWRHATSGVERLWGGESWVSLNVVTQKCLGIDVLCPESAIRGGDNVTVSRSQNARAGKTGRWIDAGTEGRMESRDPAVR